MRTVDPESWYAEVKETRNSRKLFGNHSMSAIENCLRSSFTEAMKDFWVNCSNNSVKYMRGKSMPPKVRRCFIALVMTLPLLGLLALARSWQGFRSVPPTIVTLVSSQHPVRHVDFPAVALCTNNLVSRTALKSYASYLHGLDANSTYLLADIERNLLAFGALVTLSGPPVDASFMEYLARVAHQTNVTDIIMKLTPQCSSLLIRCAWRMMRMPCDRLFALRPTPQGYCCVFNSRYQEEDLYNPARRLHFAGQDNGLAVVVREDDSDVAFLRGPEQAVQVLLFEGSEYPLVEGGGSRVQLTQRNTSAFLQLGARTQYASPYLHHHSEERRGCRMRHSRSRTLELRSHAWCVTACRRRTVRALCGCVPPLLLPRAADTVCSPHQLACLNKHKEKFTNFYPGESADASLTEEASDSMYCAGCAPDCARAAYSAAVSHAHHQHANKLFLNFFVSGLSVVNTTIIRIYFASGEQKLYVVEPNRRWYEIASVLISQWLWLVGVTLGCAAELLYHATVRWGHHFHRARHLHRTRKRPIVPSAE